MPSLYMSMSDGLAQQFVRAYVHACVRSLAGSYSAGTLQLINSIVPLSHILGIKIIIITLNS